MSEWISKLLESKEMQVAFTVACVYVLNAILTGIKDGLARIKDKTESKFDDNAHDLIVKVLNVVDKVIAFLTANKAALPPKAREEVEKPQPEKKG